MEEKKNILTYEGLRKYEDELHNLKVVKRQEVAQKIKEAREQGDLSENAEYDAAKDEQRDIEARIEELEKILKNAEVVVEDEVDLEKINIGCRVRILDMEYNEELVKEAVYREMTRGGQVYYVYNRVNNIAEVTAELQRLLPDAKVAFAHGQMKERELEEIMMGFMNHEIDVLVSTTIIETGLDIPNVNTMIIHDANQLGLSQLYQLRGRVGRSNRNAFAFLMYKKNTLLKETAEKRLQAIREFTDLGSGYKIAMRDLEIRGAGNLLGQAQSGHMEAVGYDLYCKMLNEAVLRLKGELKDEDEFDTTLDLDINAFIPSTYVYNEYQKLELYKRISSIESKDEMEDMTDELIDRFGEMPKAVYNLLYVAYLKSLAHHAYMTDVKQKGEKVSFEMKPDAAVDVEKIPAILEEYKRELSFQAGKNPTFVLDLSKTKKVKQLEKIEHCVNSLNSLIIR